jgi:hypothetical protein
MAPNSFSWEKYLKDTNAIPAPEHLFKEVSIDSLPGFLVLCPAVVHLV